MKRYLRLFPAMALVLSLILLSSACGSNDKEDGSNAATASIPTLTTTAISSISTTTATGGSDITFDGGADVTARGICWSISSPPTINDNLTMDGTGTGSFTSALTGLTAGTPYYVRAYATNSAGTAYGDEVTFTTADTTSYLYTAVQYTLDQADGTTIILRSRGTGNGTEDGLGGVEAFIGDPVWYHFDDMTAEDAVSHTPEEDEVLGHFASADDEYFLDINGGSDMGGVTYNIQTETFSAASLGFSAIYTTYLSPQDTTPIHIDTEAGGDIDTGTEDQWDDVYENENGAIFWNGSDWVTNDTAAHAYFTDLRTGERINEHIVTAIGTETGAVTLYGTAITRSTYTYTVEKASDGSGIADMGTSYPTVFDLEFTDAEGNIQELQFLPSIVSEMEE